MRKTKIRELKAAIREHLPSDVKLTKRAWRLIKKTYNEQKFNMKDMKHVIRAASMHIAKADAVHSHREQVEAHKHGS